jgi:multiple sugar transport system permease protein
MKVLKNNFRLFFLYLAVAFYLVFFLFPFYWATISSFKTNRELYDLKAKPFWIYKGVTFDHYTYLFNNTLFFRWFLNTALVAGLVTVITVSTTSLAAYSVTRFRFRGRTAFAMSVFGAYLVPPTLLFIPLYQVLRLLRVIDTVWSLVIAYPTFTVPFCTWLLMGYFKTIPLELEESALVDGATRLQALIRIVLPLALPGLMTAAVFAFTLSWSHYLYAVAFISHSPQKTLPVGVVSELVRGDVFYWGSLMAGTLLSSVPIVILYSCMTRYFIKGLTAGAMKY